MRASILIALAVAPGAQPLAQPTAPAKEQSGPALAERARATATLPSLFSDGDYPVAAVRARQEGAVDFRLDITPQGRVGGCTIVRSSGSALLDATTCRLIRTRARFIPARDTKGRPAPDTVTGRVRWALPAPPLPVA